MRVKYDDRMLDSIKNKIQAYLKVNGLNYEFFRKNMDEIGGLYVENLKEERNCLMQNRRCQKWKTS